MKKLLSLLLAFILLCGCSTKKSESQWEEVVNSNKINIGIINSDYCYKDENGKWVGFNPDLIEAVCSDLLINYELVEVTSKNYQKKLKSGAVDCIWGIIYKDSLEEDFECSIPYIYTDEVLVFLQETAKLYPDTTSLKEISSVIAAKDSLAHATATAFGLSCQTANTEKEAIKKVIDNSFSGAVVDYYIASSLLKELNSNLVIGPTLATYNNVILYNKESDLNKKLRNTLKKLIENSTIDEIAERYSLFDLLPHNRAN